MTAEEIYLSSDEAMAPDDASFAKRSVIASLEQQHRHVPGHQRFDIVEGNVLRIERRRRGGPTTHYFDLGFIDPTPRSEAYLPTWCMIAALASALLFAMLLWLDGFGLTRTTSQFAASLAAVAAIGVGAGLLAWLRYRRRIIFVTRHGQVPVVRLVDNCPTPADVRAFTGSIRSAGQKAATRLPGKKQVLLVEELKEHRRLAQAGVIAPDVYEAAKKRILSCH